MIRVLRSALLFWIGLVPLSAADCPFVHPVASGDTLRGLAEFYFGDPQFWPAIALATNSRTAAGFSFISNENRLAEGSKLCIPELAEAQRWRARFEQYERSLSAAALPQSREVQLVDFPPDQPLDVATWIRESQLAAYNGADHAPDDIWVTVEPYLKRFCAAFFSTHGRDPDQLTLRLEQRLGLPPVSSKTRVLTIRLNRPVQDVIFRPCINPTTSRTDCPPGPPPQTDYANWIYKQYYSSYSVARLSSFPWTALGYTFDWAYGPQPGDFQRFGESEFVIRKGAPIQILGAVPTADYCSN